jgi:hypothetical protein
MPLAEEGVMGALWLVENELLRIVEFPEKDLGELPENDLGELPENDLEEDTVPLLLPEEPPLLRPRCASALLHTPAASPAMSKICINFFILNFLKSLLSNLILFYCDL